MYVFNKRFVWILGAVLVISASFPIYAHAQSELVNQKKFLTNTLSTFLQRSNQMRDLIQKRVDIFTPDIQGGLLDRANHSIVAFSGYVNDVMAAQTSDELRSLAGNIYVFRTSEDALLTQEVLAAYVAYFEKTTQQLIMTRYQDIQERIVSAKNQGRDTLAIEKIFAQATTALRKLQDTVSALHEIVQVPQSPEGEALISLDQTEKGLEMIQKEVSSIYDIFRRITIQGDSVLELNKEEQKIQSVFPTW